ncbi:permease [Microbacterium sp. GXS0129]|uniref:permease n=1 Tax=Microbacterium sp. GXS0129 TaxID=3377836 RepID=UPI00383AD7D2
MTSAPVGTARSTDRAVRDRAPQSRGGAGYALIIGLGAVAALLIVNLLVPQFFAFPVERRLQDGLTLSLSVLIESMPFVLLGVLFSIVVQVWLPPGALERVLPRRAWARRLALSLLGMIIPVCECGNVPFARGLLRRGFAPAETLTFLVAAPIVNPIVIITTHAAFGWDGGILVMRVIGGFVIANLIGWLYSRQDDPDKLLTERFRLDQRAEEAVTGSRGRRSLAQLVIELRAVMPALVIGSAIAGAVQVLIPRDVLVAIGSNPVLSIVTMIVLALTVALCSNVDAFFALSMASTFSTGSIIAFLLVGPIVDVKMLALMRTTFTVRALAGIVVIVILSAFTIALGVNLVG